MIAEGVVDWLVEAMPVGAVVAAILGLIGLLAFIAIRVPRVRVCAEQCYPARVESFEYGQCYCRKDCE